MVPDLGVFGEDCEAMVVISEERRMDKMKSGVKLWNEEGGGAFRFKSTPLAQNTQEVNVCTETNVARVDEGGRPAPPCQVWSPVFWNALPLSFLFQVFGCFGPERERKNGGKEKRYLT